MRQVGGHPVSGHQAAHLREQVGDLLDGAVQRAGQVVTGQPPAVPCRGSARRWNLTTTGREEEGAETQVEADTSG
ncbi:hypothetical protein [Actinoplanes regularis]|uniref:hypothetical protein n=1 Tax=Actinoplanes regularis TaxID=52697 RepID=UPI0015C65426|nr:hypothetical protein [Actinoplanes regularis]GIE89015.1 hypothetical protein Are01nite_54950 [Actinoplanes regularis]